MKADSYTLALTAIVAIVAIVGLLISAGDKRPVGLSDSDSITKLSVTGKAIAHGVCRPETYCSGISTVVHKDLFCSLSSYGCDWGCDTENNKCRKRPSE